MNDYQSITYLRQVTRDQIKPATSRIIVMGKIHPSTHAVLIQENGRYLKILGNGLIGTNTR